MENKGYDIALFSNDFLLNRNVTQKVTESHFLYLAVSKVNPHIPLAKIYNTEFIEINIPADEVLTVLDKTSRSNKRLETIARAMVQMYIRHPTKKDTLLAVFSQISYSAKEGLTVLFNPLMTPYLLELSKIPYTNILLKDVFKLQSDYSIKMLELITMYVHKNKGCQVIEKEYTLEDFIKLLQVPDAYLVRFSNFKNRILAKAVNDINNLGNYEISYELVKGGSGNKVKAIRFRVRLPEAVYKFETNEQLSSYIIEKASQEEMEEVEDVVDFVEDKVVVDGSDDEALIDKLKKKGLFKKISREWLKKDRNRLLWAADIADAAKPNNYGAYVLSMLKNDEAYEMHVKKEAERMIQHEYNVRQQADIQKQCAEADKKIKADMADYENKTDDELKKLLETRNAMLGSLRDGKNRQVTLDSIEKITNILSKRNSQKLKKASTD